MRNIYVKNTYSKGKYCKICVVQHCVSDKLMYTIIVDLGCFAFG